MARVVRLSMIALIQPAVALLARLARLVRVRA